MIFTYTSEKCDLLYLLIKFSDIRPFPLEASEVTELETHMQLSSLFTLAFAACMDPEVS